MQFRNLKDLIYLNIFSYSSSLVAEAHTRSGVFGFEQRSCINYAISLLTEVNSRDLIYLNLPHFSNLCGKLLDYFFDLLFYLSFYHLFIASITSFSSILFISISLNVSNSIRDIEGTLLNEKRNNDYNPILQPY